VDDAPARIAGAGVVIGAAGDGLMGGVIAAGRPFICLPQARPYGEQEAAAAQLQARGAAVVLPAWPPAAAWPTLIARARALDPARLAALHDPEGARKAAAFLVAAS
jgi:UDP-N-acetylglucosamine:LPS N-acetylglucosamine transferase